LDLTDPNSAAWSAFFAGGSLLDLFKAQQQLVLGQCFGPSAEAMTLNFLGGAKYPPALARTRAPAHFAPTQIGLARAFGAGHRATMARLRFRRSHDVTSIWL
jgi:hypothetical protein